MIRVIFISLGLFFLLTTPAVAHVVVKPSETGLAVLQTFTVSVPVEKEVPTIEVRLLIPEGLTHVIPNVKQGWNIEMKREGENADGRVTEIIWNGGIIPVGQRDEFVFSAQTPANPTQLAWKAYQTYADGTIISWDQAPDSTTNDEHASSPYSETLVYDDLKSDENEKSKSSTEAHNPLPLIFSTGALIFSAAAFGLQIKRRM